MGQVNSRFGGVRSRLTVDPAKADGAEATRGASPDALVVDLGRIGKAGTTARDARRAAAAALIARMRGRAYRPLLLVRVSPLDDEATDQDLDAVMASRPDAIVLSACPDGAAVQQLGVRLGVIEAMLGLPDGATAVVAEAGARAAGLMALQSFAGASARLAALTWDAAALAEDVGGAPDSFGEDDAARGVARTLLALAARAADVPVFDTITLTKGEAFGRDCSGARRIGFAGKITQDPGQVDTINTLFARSGTPAANQAGSVGLKMASSSWPPA